MRKAIVEHYKAAAFLSSYLSSQNNLPEQGELLAVITHWLQSPEDKPMFHELSDGQRWTEALKRYILLDNGSIGIHDHLANRFPEARLRICFDSVPFPPQQRPKFTFADLFSGIGGFRIALQDLGGKCVFACDWDGPVKKTYYRNFGQVPFGDVRQFTSYDELTNAIPDHNILAAGFPCQPFSRAGISARNHLGQTSGLDCNDQGNLFFDIVRIAKVKRPDVLFLENVKNLLQDDGGNTFDTIRTLIEEDLGYDFKHAVLDSSSLVPQRRERCYIVCFRRKDNDFVFPRLTGEPKKLSSILEHGVPESYTISDKLWLGHKERSRRNLKRGTGFTVCVADLTGPSNTLVSRYGKDGKECLIPQDGKNPRKLTPRECARLQGFPENFLLADSDAPSYRQFGNAVPVPVVARIARNIVRTLKRLGPVDER